MTDALDPDQRAAGLARIYLLVGPLYRRAARVVEQAEPVSAMTVGVRAVLDQLHRDGECTVPQMARHQVLSRQFVQRMVNDARAQGYVELVDNPAHARSRLVRLTPLGRAAIDAVLEREHRLMRAVEGDLTRADLETTQRVLRHMLAHLDGLDHRRATDDDEASGNT